MASSSFVSLDNLTASLLDNKSFLLYGGQGLGKTTFALAFLAQGLSAGENVSLVTLRSAETILDQARAFGMNLELFIRSGQLLIFQYPDNVLENSSRLMDDAKIVDEFRALLGDHSVHRVVLDPVTPLLGAPSAAAATTRFQSIVSSFNSLKATCLYLVDTDDADSAVGNCKDVVNGVLRFEPGLSPGSPRRLTIERFPDPTIVRKQITFDVTPGIGLVEIRPQRLGAGRPEPVRPAHEVKTVTQYARVNPTIDHPLSGFFGATSDGEETPKILIVHADNEPRAIMASLLGPGFVVYEAQGAVEGLAIFGREVPDVVIISDELRGATGTEIIRKLRHTGYITPMILTSSQLRRRTDTVAAMQAGADLCLKEPVDGRLLLLGVQNLLRCSGHRAFTTLKVPIEPPPGREEIFSTTSLEAFCDQVQRELDYCQRYSLPLALFTLRVPAGRAWMEELATAASMLIRPSDLIYIGERGVAVLLVEAESHEPFLDRLKLRWKLDLPPILDVPRFEKTADNIRDKAQFFLANTIGVLNTNTNKNAVLSGTLVATGTGD